ncbi:MAG: VWA domain-containing protein [Acidobacteria bacterium]|nr:VWA domain-containing protein [Acidobacteriota bacterium]
MLRRATVAVALLTAAITAATAPRTSAQAPQTPPVFRGGVDVVQLDVTVLDERRQPVRGLTADDFTVLERDTPQPIVSFAAIDLPPRPVDSARWVREIAPDVTTNHQDAQRVVVIVMDDCSTPFDPGVSKLAKTIAEQTVDLLGPADLASVVYTATRRLGQEFTSDRIRLRAAVERFVPRGGTPPPSPFSASRTSSGGVAMGNVGGPCMGYRPVPQAMLNIAEVLREYPGWRKTVVFISPHALSFAADSIDTVADVGVWGEVFDAMQEGNVTVYQFDPRGLETSVNMAEDLGMLADATGGRTFRNTNAPETGVPQMFRENSSYYVLGIQPVNLVRNGRFRAIEVRVNRPGLTVRTRAGYYAPRDERPPRPSNRPQPSAVERAIVGALPSGELPMSLTTAPLAGPNSRRPVVQVVAGFTPLGLPVEGEDVDVLVTAFRDDWKEMGTVTQTVRVTPSRAETGPPHVDVPVQLELPPGRYEIRAALSRARAGQTGSAYASVVVPDFGKDPLSLSGVLIVRGRQGSAEDGVADAATGRATTVRQFLPTEQVSAVVTAHQGGRAPLLSTEVEMRIVDVNDRVRVSRSVTLDPGSFRASRAADLRFDLPLTGLEPGEYLASLTATSARGTARRDVRVVVR